MGIYSFSELQMNVFNWQVRNHWQIIAGLNESHGAIISALTSFYFGLEYFHPVVQHLSGPLFPRSCKAIRLQSYMGG